MTTDNNILDYWAKPEFTPRKNQLAALEWIEQQTSKYLILELPVGCHSKHTPILKHTGEYRKVQDIQIGDLLCGPDGTIRAVLELHRGTSPMFTVIPQYSDKFTVNDQHILSLMDIDNNVVNMSVLAYVKLPEIEKNKLFLYHSTEIEFSDSIIPLNTLDPYSVGSFLATKELSFSIPLSEIDRITDVIDGSNAFNEDKPTCVPDSYKYNSIDMRYELLAGYIDNFNKVFIEDGALVLGGIESIKLINDIRFIVNSLGFISHFKNGNLYIRGNLSKIPSRTYPLHSDEHQHIHVTEDFRVKYFKEDEYFGFTVDVDNLYVFSDFIVTHNSGKSAIGITASKFINGFEGSSYVLTPQIILQQQYMKDFYDGKKTIQSLKGRGNYDCVDKGVPCSIGHALSPKCVDCQYDADKSLAQSAYNTVMNYKLALSFFAYTEVFKPRELMIMDEAHTLEKQLVDFDMMSISYNRCKKYKIKYTEQKTIKDLINWIKDYYLPKINSVLDDNDAKIKKIKEKHAKSVSTKDAKILKEHDALISHSVSVEEMTLRNIEYIEDQYVLVHDRTQMALKRLYGAYSFKNIIEPMADRFLFMSATIPDHREFCTDLGIDVDDVSFLSLDSDFPVENRPIYYKPILKMNSKWNDENNAIRREKMINEIVDILDEHKNETGIIHSGNYQVSAWLVEELSNRGVDHQILHHNPDEFQDRNGTIDEFMSVDKPSILISPSCTEGLDLKDGLARFAVIVKIPFGYLGDQWIKRRLELSETWYRRCAIVDIIQAGGRIVRSKDDYGSVYILDASFKYLYDTTSYMIPNWWKESIVRRSNKNLTTVNS